MSCIHTGVYIERQIKRRVAIIYKQTAVARADERPEGANREGPKVPLAAGGSAAGNTAASDSERGAQQGARAVAAGALEVFITPIEAAIYKGTTTATPTSTPGTDYCGALKLTSSSSSFDIRSRYEYTAPWGAPSNNIPTARRTTSSSSGWPTAPTVEP